MKPIRILVVEDAADIREELVDYLRFYDFEVQGAENVAALKAALERGPWDVLVLDLGLPDGDGLAVAQRLREERGLALGIVMVTARGQADDRIAGLNAGADTYLVKPVNPRELKAVIDRLAARLRSAGTPEASGWRLDQENLRLHAPAGGAVALTGAEARLLSCLLAHPGETIDRDRLYQEVNPRAHLIESRSLDSLLSRLRSKVEKQTGVTLPVQTFRNLGYRFAGTVRPS
ncbi:MAG: response regulator transcription factor [Gammaproteobacteria bacterium]